ncbi:unnamed protein product, partial [Amoebophrya sp. A120]
ELQDLHELREGQLGLQPAAAMGAAGPSLDKQTKTPTASPICGTSSCSGKPKMNDSNRVVVPSSSSASPRSCIFVPPANETGAASSTASPLLSFAGARAVMGT